MNRDGRLDFLTARTTVTAGTGELLWLEHPAEGIDHAPWNEHVLGTGPDIMFEMVELKGYEDYYVLFVSEFFSTQMSVITIHKQTLEFKRRVFDDTMGHPYSTHYTTISKGAKPQILVNNHEEEDAKTAVYVYDVPEDLMNGEFKRTKIASGFKNAFNLFVPNMAPGFCYPVFPKVANEGKEDAYILVAGDGDYSAHVLKP